MKITIHRGINQIGGCVTEIQSDAGTKIVIDLGHNLPKGDKPAPDKFDDDKELDALLRGVNAVFYTHGHGDHIGFEAKVHKKHIPQFIGILAREVLMANRRHMVFAKELSEQAKASLEALREARVYQWGVPVNIKDIRIWPFRINHSAPDSYMFFIECDGKCVLHTGDFRTHGYAKEGTLCSDYYLALCLNRFRSGVIRKPVDVLIMEGTMLNREDSRVKTEFDVWNDIQKVLDKHKYAFALCSSTDADRLSSLFQANKNASVKGQRLFIVDEYQNEVLTILRSHLGTNGRCLHNFKGEIMVYNPRSWYHSGLLEQMKKRGFMMLVRHSDKFDSWITEIMDQLDDCALIYSQFGGYINPRHSAYKHSLAEYVYDREWKVYDEGLHTSGHADRQALTSLCKNLSPQSAIIPIHREEASDFSKLDLDQSLKDKITTASVAVDGIEIVIK